MYRVYLNINEIVFSIHFSWRTLARKLQFEHLLAIRCINLLPLVCSTGQKLSANHQRSTGLWHRLFAKEPLLRTRFQIESNVLISEF